MVSSNKVLRSLFLLVLFVSVIGVAFAILPSTQPCWVKGSVQGTDVNIDGLPLTFYLGSSLLNDDVLSASADNNANFSMNSIGANTGNLISIKVAGVKFADFNFVGYCKTGSDPWIVLNEFNVFKQTKEKSQKI